MAVITIVGSGMMGSAIGIPAADNGHEVRLVGTPLDREIIDHARETGFHMTMKRQLPESYTYYQFEEMQEAPPPNNKSSTAESFEKVFIVHGHDGELKQAVARVIEKQDIEAIIPQFAFEKISARILKQDVRAYNTFDNPENVKIEEYNGITK